MPLIIKHNQVIEDKWQLLGSDCSIEEALLASQPIVPLTLWQNYATELKQLTKLGIWLDSHETIEEIVGDLPHFSLVALNFPTFTDGRHFSSARLLRERYAYSSEVRAIGDVLRDQLFFMQRCGFDAYAVRADRCPHDALISLTEFSVCYQGAADSPEPLFRRRALQSA
ncbi:DUF934 domain-containing protein [Thiopseudomonas acetoxidans]|uniref:DUF934 domain-containing protein n=1 Tax=Thiopseudomonas acetoxidans TaxID=3041622 RepID=A0ABT7SRV2_9GAMM|nr:DUF934 domain-containing protein [Thiopseudomonas sp. CY1220]MDM7858910.1 DUF934 domain-containing protein [Thiopseudomonas sp. CY1220]